MPCHCKRLKVRMMSSTIPINLMLRAPFEAAVLLLNMKVWIVLVALGMAQ